MSAQRLEVEKLKSQMIKHGVKQQAFSSSIENIENQDVNIRPSAVGTAEKEGKKRPLGGVDAGDVPGTISTLEMRYAAPAPVLIRTSSNSTPDRPTNFPHSITHSFTHSSTTPSPPPPCSRSGTKQARRTRKARPLVSSDGNAAAGEEGAGECAQS